MKKEIKFTKLNDELKKRKITYQEFAKILDITEVSVYFKLRGIHKWNIKEINIILKEFNKKYEELFYFED